MIYRSISCVGRCHVDGCLHKKNTHAECCCKPVGYSSFIPGNVAFGIALAVLLLSGLETRTCTSHTYARVNTHSNRASTAFKHAHHVCVPTGTRAHTVDRLDLLEQSESFPVVAAIDMCVTAVIQKS